MEEEIKTMSYKQFKAWCNVKASDRSWNSIEAITCLQVIKKIDSIKVKGLFNKKRATEKAREDAFSKIKEVICNDKNTRSNN